MLSTDPNWQDREHARLSRIFTGLSALPATASQGDVALPNLLGQWYTYETNFNGPGNIWVKSGVGANDTFTRANSTTTPGNAESGQPYIPIVGTWGISSNQLYSQSDATTDQLALDVFTANPTIQASISGTIAGGANFRIPTIQFRVLDANNFLEVFLFNALVNLRKKDGGVLSTPATAATTTTDGVTYQVCVQANGDVIKIWVDGVLKITYTVAAGEQKYSGYHRCGFQLGKGGAPATAARIDNLLIRQAA